MEAGHGPAVSNEEDHNAVDFRDIVDRDESCFKERASQLFAGYLVESLPFRVGILVAITINSIVVGLQTNRYLEANYGAVLLGFDKFFQTFFAIEMLIKWYHDFLGFWKVGWNIFDFVIITLSFLVPGLGFLNGTRIVHVVRVLHATRSLRSISTLKSLQIVMQTVIYSLPDMANVMALLIICIFVFAIMGNSIFAQDCPKNFGSVEKTMFALFICITQDGWLQIVEELNSCGQEILGPIYLTIFITIGTFVFANLVVAVVVTNLEWVITENKEVDKKLQLIKQDAAKLGDDKPDEVCTIHDKLFSVASVKSPLTMNIKSMEKYLGMVSALEENFMDFKRLKEELCKVQQEIHALQALDEVSNEELLELSEAIPASKSAASPMQKTSRSGTAGGGDIITEMLGLMRKSPIQTAQARSIHHMITQLVHREPSDALRRPSLMVHPSPSEMNPRRASQFLESIPQEVSSTLHNRPAPTAPLTTGSTLRRPHSSIAPDPPTLPAYHFLRRHTLSTVPETVHLQRSASSS